MERETMEIKLKPIGVVRVKESDEEIKSKWLKGAKGVIEIFEEYADGLDGIDGFSHLIVTAYLHKTTEEQRKVIKVKPRRLRHLGINLEELPEVGVFCTDSPHRPNPIAITIVKFIRRRGRLLEVEDLDLFDGTPVLDIKPYTPSRRIEDLQLPTWYQEVLKKVREKCPELQDF